VDRDLFDELARLWVHQTKANERLFEAVGVAVRIWAKDDGLNSEEANRLAGCIGYLPSLSYGKSLRADYEETLDILRKSGDIRG
jgi:hypothetical protein